MSNQGEGDDPKRESLGSPGLLQSEKLLHGWLVTSQKPDRVLETIVTDISRFYFG